MYRRTLILSVTAVFVLAFASTAALADGTDPEPTEGTFGKVSSLPKWETEAEKEAFSDKPAPIPTRGDGERPPPSAGYRVPGEFEPVSSYVVNYSSWHSNMGIEMIQEGTRVGGAHAVVLTENGISGCESALENAGVPRFRFTCISPSQGLNDIWARDFGPISIYENNGDLAFVDLHYYDSRWRDDAVPEYMADEIGINRFGLEGSDQSPPDDVLLYMEGGNYMTDGQGTCILSDDIDDDNQQEGNSSADTIAEVEPILQDYLGCDTIVWLQAVPYTSTGHVDLGAKLLTATEVIALDFDGPSGSTTVDALVDENAATLDAAGFEVTRIISPPLGDDGWGWTYYTYTNSVMLNHVVMVPIYDQGAYDDDGLEVYRSILGSSYNVIGIDSQEIASAGGSVHCTTMQIATACGNGVLEPIIEECDGANLNGETCDSLGYDGGDLDCTDTCQYDISDCGGAPDTDTDTDTDSDTDSDADTDTDTDTDTDDDADGEDDDGCGCDTAGENQPGLLGALLKLL